MSCNNRNNRYNTYRAVRKCFENANQILINWKTYTDNDLIYDDGRPCLERFTTPMDINKHAEPDEYNWIVTNELTKCIIRTNIKVSKSN